VVGICSVSVMAGSGFSTISLILYYTIWKISFISSYYIMPIERIEEIPNAMATKMPPIKEKQDIYIPGIKDPNIPSRNGFIYLLTGSGGSGKTSLSLGMFKNKNMYRGKFDNIFYICPENSFLSAIDHPFKDHDKVFHELTVGLLEEIYQSLIAIKVENEEKHKRKKEGNKPKYVGDEEQEKAESSDDDEEEVRYSCVFIDDFADRLKDTEIQKQLNKMLIKARHICCAFMFTLQWYFYFPKMLRKQITNATIFKPKNVEEFVTLAHELFNMKADDALTLFNFTFQKDYDHLDLDTWKNQYYRNFNELDIKFDNKCSKEKISPT
jgi:hypothetical protein